jgi:hypothetical protein
MLKGSTIILPLKVGLPSSSDVRWPFFSSFYRATSFLSKKGPTASALPRDLSKIQESNPGIDPATTNSKLQLLGWNGVAIELMKNQRRFAPRKTGRLAPEQVPAFLRNQWPESPEYAAMAFDKTGPGARNAWASVSQNISNYRASRSKGVSFSDEDRKKQKSEGKGKR